MVMIMQEPDTLKTRALNILWDRRLRTRSFFLSFLLHTLHPLQVFDSTVSTSDGEVLFKGTDVAFRKAIFDLNPLKLCYSRKQTLRVQVPTQ